MSDWDTQTQLTQQTDRAVLTQRASQVLFGGWPLSYFGAVAPEARQGKRVMAVIHALGYRATYVRKGGPS
jgi:hypothetical protein